MEKFSATITRTVTHYLNVEIEANSKSEAEMKAHDMAGDLDFHDGTSGDPTYNVENIKRLGQAPRNLVVDGTDTSGHFVGDGKFPPFVVFDVNNQEIIGGPFKTHERAESEKEMILDGKKPLLNKVALKKWIDKIDSEK